MKKKMSKKTKTVIDYCVLIALMISVIGLNIAMMVYPSIPVAILFAISSVATIVYAIVLLFLIDVDVSNGKDGSK